METEQQKKLSARGETMDWVEAILFSFVLVVLFFTFFFRMATVSGSSMYPTLVQNERIIIRCICYQPQRGDIIVVDTNSQYGKPLVKRLIALEGDTVDIDRKTGKVYLNGKLLPEEYLPEGTFTQLEDLAFPITVGKNQVLAMGDNRSVSLDSRSSEIGMIDVHDILGKAVLRVFPLQKFGKIEQN